MARPYNRILEVMLCPAKVNFPENVYLDRLILSLNLYSDPVIFLCQGMLH